MPKSNVTLEEWCLSNNCHDLLSHLVNRDDARKFSYSSHVKVQWKCDKGHVFDRTISNMTSKGVFTCTICNGHQVVVGFNDLATTRPDLAAEWDYERNILLPTQVTRGSYKDVWWKCANGHEWKARISARDYRNGCPYCNGRSRTSLPEQIVFYYCKKHFPDSLNMYGLGGVSYDICIPSKHVVVEYDGSIWHTDKDTTYKFKHASQNGYTLYKISGVLDSNEPNTFKFGDDNLNIVDRHNPLVTVLYEFLLRVLGVDENFSDYRKAYLFAKGQKSTIKGKVIDLPDNLEFEWSLLNGYDLKYASNDNTDKYWRCFHGHTFTRRLDVIKRGYIACPFCGNKISFLYNLAAKPRCFSCGDTLQGLI